MQFLKCSTRYIEDWEAFVLLDVISKQVTHTSGERYLKHVKCFIRQKLTPADHFIFKPDRKEADADNCSRQLASSLRLLAVNGPSYLSMYWAGCVNPPQAGSQRWKNLQTFITPSSLQ